MKKGEMTVGVTIAIIVGVVVLGFLIFGFSTGWGNFWDRITGVNGNSNVDAIIQGCELACSGKGFYSYCEEEKTVEFKDGESQTGSCNDLRLKLSEFGMKECSLNCNDMGSTSATSTSTTSSSSISSFKTACENAGGSVLKSKSGACSSKTIVSNGVTYYCCKGQ